LESAEFCGEIVAKLLGARDLSAPKACMCFGSRLRLEKIRRLKSEASSFVVPAVERRVMEVIAQRAAATGAVAMLQGGGGGAPGSHECDRSSKSIASRALTR
jgi:hypothetical protein